MVKGNDFPIGVVKSYSREQLIELVTVLGILPADKASDLTLGELRDVVTKYNLEQKSKESKATKSTKTSKKTEDKESKPSSKGSKSSKTTKTTKTTKANSTEASEETDASLSETKQTKTSTKKTSKKANKSDKAEETTDNSKNAEDIVVQELLVAEQDVESASVVSTDVASETTSDKPVKKSKSTKSSKSSKATKSKKEDKDAKDKTEQIDIEQLDNIEKTEDTNTSVKEENLENNKSSKSNKKSSGKKTKKTSKKDVEETSVSVSEEKEEIIIVATEDDKETASTPVSPKKTQNNKNNGRSAKRSFTFGPDTSATENSANLVETTSENSSNENNEAEGEDVPAVPAEPVVTMIEAEGVLSIPSSDKGEGNGNGNGFLHKTNYLPGEGDVYVGQNIIRRNGLRRGDYVKCLVVDNKNPKEKYAPLKKILEVNGIPYDEETTPELLKKRPRFERLTAIYPDEKLSLETPYNPNKKRDFSTRIIDLFSPIGKGQRGMIVSPPKAGKTVLLKKVANAITTNNPKCKLIVLLIDERPEEVTDMQRSITGEVVYSTFDKKPENHVRVTELVLERAMRMVELGEDVVILLDSMTRLARAYNLTINPTGRTLSGGLDPGSLYGPKRFFGAARNIEGGGSLTIIATALVETGSKMDEVIFEEFKGTGNMEIVLDRKLADRRVFPAIAVDKSGTRREDLLLTEEEREAIWLLRKRIADVDTVAATEAVLNFMEKTMTNASFVASIRKSFSAD